MAVALNFLFDSTESSNLAHFREGVRQLRKLSVLLESPNYGPEPLSAFVFGAVEVVHLRWFLAECWCGSYDLRGHRTTFSEQRRRGVADL